MVTTIEFSVRDLGRAPALVERYKTLLGVVAHRVTTHKWHGPPPRWSVSVDMRGGHVPPLVAMDRRLTEDRTPYWVIPSAPVGALVAEPLTDHTLQVWRLKESVEEFVFQVGRGDNGNYGRDVGEPLFRVLPSPGFDAWVAAA